MKVFLSHKHSQAHQTDVFRKYLGRLAPDRFDFFASSADIEQGVDWSKKVKQKLYESDWLIALTNNCTPGELNWIIREITMFTELEDDSKPESDRRCIIVRNPETIDSVFSHLQQFPADIDGCKKFLRHILSTSKNCMGFNPYVGDYETELNREAVRLWEILVDKPLPNNLLPKAIYRFTAEDREQLCNDVMSDAVIISMNLQAAQINGLPLSSNSHTWEGNFGNFRSYMTEEQKVWIPLFAFLLDKVFEEKRTQNAFILYPNKDQNKFYIPIVSEIYEFSSGDIEFELIYFPIETGFPQKNICEKDFLFHLMALCFNVQWRLIDRYKEKVSEYAAAERSKLKKITEEFIKNRSNLAKKILIDLLKIHSESSSRGIVNVEKIYGLFSENEHAGIEGDFMKWMEVFQTIQAKSSTLEAVALETAFNDLQKILDKCLGRYSSKLNKLLGGC